MTPLLEQFLSEARESLEGISEKLMQLESAPDDKELMTQLFRLVHTLKGNSGLFEFPEMTRVLHAGEDLMDAVRHGEVSYSQALADRLLDAMDFVGMLCDDIERETQSSASSAAEAEKMARQLRQLMKQSHGDSPEPQETGAALAADPASDGITPGALTMGLIPEDLRLAAWRQAQTGTTLMWVTYRPAEDCFFQGEDPLHQAKLTPGLLWGGMAARAPWPELADLDAYRCMLDFSVLSCAPRAELDEHYRYVPDQIQITALNPLALVVPQGDPNGGPVYEDFVSDALGFLAGSDLDGLARAVRSMLELSSRTLWLSSALRWLQVILESTPTDTRVVRMLVESLRTLESPNWSALLAGQTGVPALQTPAPAPAPTSVQAALSSAAVVPEKPDWDAQALSSVLEFQREILALPDDASWLGGRIKAAVASLSGCLRMAGRAHEVDSLKAAAREALAASRAAPLAHWLETAFPEGAPITAATLVAPAAPAALTGEPLGAPARALEPAPALHEDELTATTTEARFGRRAEDSVGAKSLKVDQTKIDRLMNLIGEMVVAKNAIPYLADRAEKVFGVRDLSREIKAQYAVINRISEEMQDAIMQVRMMPVSFVFQRFPRLVRDTSRRLGKEVNLVLQGEDTAADKNIIEALSDPLVHIVRNSLDHGLELPNVRRAAGKPTLGTLRIIAKQESDRVLIEISDDGKGIDPAVIKLKAYQKGLIDEVALDRISDQEAVNLVFAPGFSTAEVVSDLSGRGVGMDVVRTAVEQVNGSIVIDSVTGRGTTIRLSLPLSMAVTHVMTIESDGQMFGVPMDAVVETVRVPRSAIRRIKQRMATVLRGRVVPLTSLNSLLSLPSEPLANDSDELAVLVVRIGEDTLGLLVDDFHGTSDIILKPLAGVLGGLRAYSGSALMGDGSVLMVLNVKEML